MTLDIITSTDDLLLRELCEPPVAEVRIDLIGSDAAAFGDEVLTHRTPIFEWCRRLVARGYDPATPLVAYRVGRAAIRIRAIGEGAELTVKETQKEGPRL
jgi:hypothetical protein